LISDLLLFMIARAARLSADSPANAFSYQIRGLYEERSAVTTEAGHNLSGERIRLVDVHVVVVAQIKRCTRAWRPPGEKLGTHAGAKRVVVDDGARKCGACELVGASESKNIDVKSGKASILSHQPVLDDIQRHAQFIRGLVSHAAGKFKQITCAGIEWSAWSEHERSRTHSRVASTAAKVEVKMIEAPYSTGIKLNLLVVL